MVGNRSNADILLDIAIENRQCWQTHCANKRLQSCTGNTVWVRSRLYGRVSLGLFRLNQEWKCEANISTLLFNW